MEESVTRKFVHEESGSVTSLCGAVEACLSQGTTNIIYTYTIALKLVSDAAIKKYADTKTYYSTLNKKKNTFSGCAYKYPINPLVLVRQGTNRPQDH